MRHLVIGLGEVGCAVKAVLNDKYDTVGIDKDEEAEGRFEFIHICYPYNAKSKAFSSYTKSYQRKYLADGGVTVIHSTVPVGTSRKLNATHSPIRGVHPHLKEGVKTFVKYFGGEGALAAATVFRACGVIAKVYDDAETPEAIKLWDTTQYGMMIVINKEIKTFCNRYGLDFEAIYSQANRDYNEGYTVLGRKEVVRPILKHMDGVIGGHCVIPNAEILEAPLATFLLRKNREYRRASVDREK